MKISAISAKVLTASLILAASTGLAFAKSYKGENYKGEAVEPCPAPAMLLGGFYLGGQVGYDSYHVDESFDVTPVAGLSGNPKISAPGWLAGLFLGYGQYWDTFYLGGEVFGNWTQADESYTINNTASAPTILSYTNKFEVNSNYGISILPGLRLNDTTTGYIRLGWNWANLKGKETTPAGSLSKSKTSNGFQYGIGLETLLTGNWSLRGEYNHTKFNSFSSTNNTKWDPSDNQALLGIVYHFA